MKVKIIKCSQCGKRVILIETKKRIEYKCRKCGYHPTDFIRR